MNEAISGYLSHCRELNRLCTQNGWIDSDSIRWEVVDGDLVGPVIAVQFTEIVMEGAGCVAARVPCYGRMRITLDRDGNVQRAEPL